MLLIKKKSQEITRLICTRKVRKAKEKKWSFIKSNKMIFTIMDLIKIARTKKISYRIVRIRFNLIMKSKEKM